MKCTVPSKLRRLRKIARRPEQHRGVTVMTAPMELARDDRPMRHVVELLHGQRVDVGPQADRTHAVAAAKGSDHAGLRQAFVGLDAPGTQLVGNQRSRTELLERRLRMRVDIAPPRRHVVMERSDAVDDVHRLHIACRWFQHQQGRRSPALLDGFDGLPDGVRGRRHRHVAHAQGAERVNDGVDHRGWRGRRSRLPDALDPKRIGRGRHLMQPELVGRDRIRARHGVVHERAGDHLAGIPLPDRMLHQRLTDALGNAAVQLPFDDHRIEDPAGVMHHDIGQQLGRTGFRIDLNLTDMATIREGAGRRLKRFHGLQRRVGNASGFRDCLERNRAVGPHDAILAVRKVDVLLGRLERGGGKPPALLDQRTERHLERGTIDHH